MYSAYRYFKYTGKNQHTTGDFTYIAYNTGGHWPSSRLPERVWIPTHLGWDIEQGPKKLGIIRKYLCSVERFLITGARSLNLGQER